MTLFEGFTHHRIVTDAAEIDLVTGGNGPPVLLLHGFPQTREAWHRVAPALADRFTLVVPDLRGYGRSRGPAPDADGAAYAKREMARDMVAAMTRLGHDAWHVAGHDRGGRVGYRMALDRPGHVLTFAALDIMTTLDTWEAMDWRAAIAGYHWPFLAQEAGFVEAMIGHDRLGYLDHLLTRWQGRDARFDPVALAAYREAFARPEVIAAMAADYRAGAGIDIALDRADRAAGRRLAAPMIVLRGSQYEPRPLADAWAPWAVDGRPPPEMVFDCGHFLAEEAPDAVTRALSDHFGGA